MNKRHLRAFTLVEMLAVMGIIAILLAVSLPAFNSMTQQTGRKAAVSELLGLLEQARVSALEKGRDTHVVFLTDTSPALSKDERYRAYAVFQDSDSAGGAPTQITKWTFLPKGVAFMGSVPSQTIYGALKLPVNGGLYRNATGFPYITFSPTGSIVQPNSGMLNIYLFEGYADSTGKPVYQSTDNIFLEKISLSRFTGRAQLEISKPPDSP
jgi:prepilin-type N-terminal cleavage/methylation domain-containing protein